MNAAEIAATAALIESVRKIGKDWLGPIIDDVVAGIRSKTTARWHLKNLLDLLEIAVIEIENRGLRPEHLSVVLREIVPILEAAADEDDESIRDMWARLLANALDPSVSTSAVNIASILRQITPREALILHQVWLLDGGGRSAGVDASEVARTIGLDSSNPDFEAMLFHLKLMGLVEGRIQHAITRGNLVLPVGPSPTDRLSVSPLGELLIKLTHT